MKASLKGILIVAANIAAALGAHANSYTVVDLGVKMNPVGVNKGGVVAANTEEKRERAEVYRSGAWHKLPKNSLAEALNRAGDVAGEDEGEHPTLWPHQSRAVVLDLPDGATLGEGLGINDSDAIVGWFLASDESAHCYVWNPGAGAVDISAGQWASCDAFGVNDAGEVTGEASADGKSGRAFVWSGGTYTDLGLLKGTISTRGLAINARGHVVGTAVTTGGVTVAFLWDGTLKPLEWGNSVTQALSINASDDIVGGVQNSGESTGSAVRWAGSKMVLLESEVADLGDWHLEAATAINDKGVIVGSGLRTTTGLLHAFMLVPQ